MYGTYAARTEMLTLTHSSRAARTVDHSVWPVAKGWLGQYVCLESLISYISCHRIRPCMQASIQARRVVVEKMQMCIA